MKTESRVIATAIDLYFEGLSVRKVANQLQKIFGVHSSQSTVWNWIMKYSKMVSEFVETLEPHVLGIYKVDDTAIKCKGVQKWFWEIIDEETKFLVASHLSSARTAKDAITLFQKAMIVAKKKPISIYVDGLQAYVKGFNKVFWIRYKKDKVELVRKVGLRAVNSNNSVERLHGTLKDRVKPMRGLKDMETVSVLLEGWVVHYNYVRGHQTLKGKTPAEVCGIEGKNNWHTLVKEAIRDMTEMEIALENRNQNQTQEQPIMVRAK